MDTQIIIWEMSLESEQPSETLEEIATFPCEPYKLYLDTINWN